MTFPDITSHQIKLALGGLRFDSDIVVDMWTLKPSIGLVARDIDRLGLSITSFKEPLSKAIQDVMLPSIRTNFDREGRPTWEALSEDTVKLRGSSGPILNRSGALKRGASSFNIWTITDTAATVKSLPDSIWYGVVHQAGIGGFGQHVAAAQKALGSGARPLDIIKEAFRHLDAGSKVHKVRIPQRQFIMYQEDDIDDIQLVFYEWLVTKTIEVGKFGR